jgi:hypothetical protein
VTAPLHKEGLHAAGLSYPGHTEILAERTGVRAFAMVLATPGLAVAHVTLHLALRDVFRHLSPAAVAEKAHLLDGLLTRMLGRRPRLGVAALNPHAGDGGLFGDEETRIIAPGVEMARAAGLQVSGPWPADTLFVRAREGEFDGVVAMYHDQGHIALKLFGRGRLVNISAGLPIVRTSVAHGTAYDIAGRGLADAASLVEATRVAALLAATQPPQRPVTDIRQGPAQTVSQESPPLCVDVSRIRSGRSRLWSLRLWAGVVFLLGLGWVTWRFWYVPHVEANVDACGQGLQAGLTLLDRELSEANVAPCGQWLPAGLTLGTEFSDSPEFVDQPEMRGWHPDRRKATTIRAKLIALGAFCEDGVIYDKFRRKIFFHWMMDRPGGGDEGNPKQREKFEARKEAEKRELEQLEAQGVVIRMWNIRGPT